MSENASYQVLVFPARQLPEQYVNMILSKWLRSLKYGNDYFKLADSDSYYTHYNDFIRRILMMRETEVRIAALSDDHDVALGWSVSRRHVLDYVHVHTHMRKQGIGAALIPKGITTITHLTRPAMEIWQSKYPEFIFNPFQ